MMGVEKEILFHFEGDLLPDHELINKTKDILENVCEKLSTLSSEPLDDTLSHLDTDNKLPSILKLSSYIESWANNHTREEKQRIQAQNNSTRENLSFPQEKRNRQAELDEKIEELRTRSKDLERIMIENEIFHKLFRPNADGQVLSVSTEKSIQYMPPAPGANFMTRHERHSNSHQESSNNTVPDHPIPLKGKEKEVSASSSDELVPSTPASKFSKSSPGRGLLTPALGIITFRTPLGSRPGNSSPCYRFSDCVSIKPNPLYSPHPSTSNSLSDAKYVTAHCPIRKTIRVSLSDSHWEAVQRVSPTELFYPDIEFQGPCSSDDLKNLLPLPLPVTLEELFYGVMKKVTFSKVEYCQQGKSLLSKIHLDVNVKAGMSAGQKIEIRTGRGWPIRRLFFLVYEIEHPVFSRQYFDNSSLQLYCRNIGGPSEPESIQITFIDGEQKLIHLNDFPLRGIGGAEIEKRGMPRNAVPNGPRGALKISPPRRLAGRLNSDSLLSNKSA